MNLLAVFSVKEDQKKYSKSRGKFFCKVFFLLFIIYYLLKSRLKIFLNKFLTFYNSYNSYNSYNLYNS